MFLRFFSEIPFLLWVSLTEAEVQNSFAVPIESITEIC
jgi:hypothetical protein